MRPARRSRNLLLAALLVLGLLWLSRLSLSTQASDHAALQFSPASIAMEVGASAPLTVAVSDAVDLYGIQFELEFDEQVLRVVDAQAGNSGVQIGSGDCPQADFTVRNQADNASGNITFAATQLNPTPACSGGTVAEIEFECLAAGRSAIIWNSVLLADFEGAALSHAAAPGTVTCALFWINLPVILQAP